MRWSLTPVPLVKFFPAPPMESESGRGAENSLREDLRIGPEVLYGPDIGQVSQVVLVLEAVADECPFSDREKRVVHL